MCGRFVQTAPPPLLAERFRVDEVIDVEAEPNFNVTPRTAVPVVRVRTRDGHRVLSRLRWGLVPSWAKDPSMGDRLINARAETIATTNAYKGAFVKRRCLVPADGFYEWKKVQEAGRRTRQQPYFIHRRDGEPLAFAGLWEIWRDPSVPDDDDEHAWLRTCVIVTTRANGLLLPVHDRMPVMLAEQDWDRWLDPSARAEDLKSLLQPAPNDWLELFPVSERVNRPDNNGPELVRRLDS